MTDMEESTSLKADAQAREPVRQRSGEVVRSKGTAKETREVIAT